MITSEARRIFAYICDFNLPRFILESLLIDDFLNTPIVSHQEGWVGIPPSLSATQRFLDLGHKTECEQQDVKGEVLREISNVTL